MEEEKKSATNVMRDLLKGDRTLLARREELANAVQQSALPRKEKLARRRRSACRHCCASAVTCRIRRAHASRR